MDESNLFGVSVRGWITVTMVGTVCAMAFLAKDVKEPLYSLVLLAVGYYFGQKTPGKQNGPPST